MPGDDQRATVLGDQRRGGRTLRLERVDDATDVAGARQLVAEPGDLSTQRRVAAVELGAVGVADDEHDPGVGVVAEFVVQQRRGSLALGGAVGEAGRLQAVLDVIPERARQDHEDAGQRQHEFGPAPGEVGYALEQGRVKLAQ